MGFKMGWGKKGPYSSMNIGGIKRRSHLLKQSSKQSNKKLDKVDIVVWIIVIFIFIVVLVFLWNYMSNVTREYKEKHLTYQPASVNLLNNLTKNEAENNIYSNHTILPRIQTRTYNHQVLQGFE